MTITEDGIKKGWVVERMLERRMMPEMLLLPNSQILITGGTGTGYAAVSSVSRRVGNGNADHPVNRSALYDPNAAAGSRFSNALMPESPIGRLYHSTATLTPQGNILIAGSNPNNFVQTNVPHPSEYRVEHLNPPFFNTSTITLPKVTKAPPKLEFNKRFSLEVSVPPLKSGQTLQVALMDLGFSTHAFHSSQRLVYLDAQLSQDGKSLRVTTPPNNRVFPPGPSYIYLVLDDMWGPGYHVMVGSGASPPVPDQGNLAS